MLFIPRSSALIPAFHAVSQETFSPLFASSYCDGQEKLEMRDVNIFETSCFVSRLRASCLLLTFLAVLSLSFNTQAQSVGASVGGRVTDERGANVAGAEVRLRSRSGVQLFGRTNGEGVYNFTGLGVGEYILEVTAEGFATQTSQAVLVERGAAVKHDFQLAIAAVNESVVVVASGTPQRADEVSKAVTVINDQEIEARRELTLTEALRGTPGLRVQQQGTPGSLTTLRLRGLRNYDTSILLDGLRVRDAGEIRGSAAALIPDLLPAGLERVEILRGSGSSIYGTNAIGGVINLVPGTGTGRPRFETSFEGGSLALYRERVQGSGGIGSRAGYSFGLTRLDVRRGVDGNDEYGNTAGGGRVQFEVTPNISIAANFYGTISNFRINNDPLALTAAFTSTERYPRAIEGVTFRADTDDPDAGRRNRLLVGSARFTQRVNDIFSYTVAYQRVSSHRRNYDGALTDGPFGVFVSTNNGLTDTLDGRANVRLGRANLITAGFEFEREKFFQESIPSFNLLNGTTDRQRTFAIFGQDQIVLLDDRLQISVGVRGQFYRIRAADRPGFLGAIPVENSLTGDGSIAYFIRSTGTKLRAHVGNGFRAPSLFERFGEGSVNGVFQRIGDPLLRAEQSIGADGGFDQRLAGDRVLFGATYFYTRLQRVIDSTFPDPLGIRFFAYANRPGGIARGLETFLEAAPSRSSNVRASYTYTNSDRFVPGTGLLQEYVIPKHLFALAFTQRYRRLAFNFDLNRTGAYLAPVFGPTFNTAILLFDGYTKADLFASYEYSLTERARLTLFIGADNIFNAKYFENGYRAPGALGRGGMKVQF
jgi:iron complex outermembrane receptor protein